VFQLRPSRRLARIHRRALNPWWFSADGSGRFDLEPEQGTCYLAGEPLGAFVEAFRDQRVVHASTVADRALATLRVATRLRLADCTVGEARRFGITLEIGASDDYELCRRWAHALAGEGFAGIRYRLRHDPSGSLVGIALFRAAGEADSPVEASGTIPTI
jgi:RES domain